MWSWPNLLTVAEFQLTEVQLGRYIALGIAVGTAVGVIFARLVSAAITWKRGKSKISLEQSEANRKAASEEFDFQQRIDASIETARKKLIRDQDTVIKKLENKVDRLEQDNERCRKDYQEVQADGIAQKKINLELTRHINQLEFRMKKYEELMMNAGINFIPLIIIRNPEDGNSQKENGGAGGGK